MEVYCADYRSCKTWWRGVPRASGPACVPGTNLVVLVDFEAWVYAKWLILDNVCTFTWFCWIVNVCVYIL